MSLARRHRDRGAAAVEFALILPILVVILGGIIDFGRAFNMQVILANAAREGARVASIQLPGEAVSRATNASFGMSGTVTVQVVGTCPGDSVTVTVSNPFQYTILAGIPGLPQPGSLSSSATMRCV